jgi:hypothetical protein
MLSAHPVNAGAARQHQGCQAGHREEDPLRHACTSIEVDPGRRPPLVGSRKVPLRSTPGRLRPGRARGACDVCSCHGTVETAPGRSGCCLLTSPAHRSLYSCHGSACDLPPGQTPPPPTISAAALRERFATLRHLAASVQGTMVLSLAGYRTRVHAVGGSCRGHTAVPSRPPVPMVRRPRSRPLPGDRRSARPAHARWTRRRIATPTRPGALGSRHACRRRRAWNHGGVAAWTTVPT